MLLCNCSQDSSHNKANRLVESKTELLKLTRESLTSAWSNLTADGLHVNKLEAIALTRFGLSVSATWTEKLHVQGSNAVTWKMYAKWSMQRQYFVSKIFACHGTIKSYLVTKSENHKLFFSEILNHLFQYTKNYDGAETVLLHCNYSTSSWMDLPQQNAAVSYFRISHSISIMYKSFYISLHKIVVVL